MSTKQKVVVELFEKLDRLDDRARNSVGLTKAMLADYRAALSAQDVQEAPWGTVTRLSERERTRLAEIAEDPDAITEPDRALLRLLSEVGMVAGTQQHSPALTDQDKERLEEAADWIEFQRKTQPAIRFARFLRNLTKQFSPQGGDAIGPDPGPGPGDVAVPGVDGGSGRLLSEGVGEDGPSELELRLADAYNVLHHLMPRNEDGEIDFLVIEDGGVRVDDGAFSAFGFAFEGGQGCLDNEEFEAKRRAAYEKHKETLRLPVQPDPTQQPAQEGEDDWPEVTVVRDGDSALEVCASGFELRRYVPAPDGEEEP